MLHARHIDEYSKDDGDLTTLTHVNALGRTQTNQTAHWTGMTHTLTHTHTHTGLLLEERNGTHTHAGML